MNNIGLVIKVLVTFVLLFLNTSIAYAVESKSTFAKHWVVKGQACVEVLFSKRSGFIRTAFIDEVCSGSLTWNPNGANWEEINQETIFEALPSEIESEDHIALCLDGELQAFFVSRLASDRWRISLTNLSLESRVENRFVETSERPYLISAGVTNLLYGHLLEKENKVVLRSWHFASGDDTFSLDTRIPLPPEFQLAYIASEQGDSFTYVGVNSLGEPIQEKVVSVEIMPGSGARLFVLGLHVYDLAPQQLPTVADYIEWTAALERVKGGSSKLLQLTGLPLQRPRRRGSRQVPRHCFTPAAILTRLLDWHMLRILFEDEPDPSDVPDYRLRVANPISLAVILHRAVTGELVSAAAAEAQVREMLANCMSYNKPRTFMHVMAEALALFMERQVALLGIATSEP